jgi:hypothetical protein
MESGGFLVKKRGIGMSRQPSHSTKRRQAHYLKSVVALPGNTVNHEGKQPDKGGNPIPATVSK